MKRIDGSQARVSLSAHRDLRETPGFKQAESIAVQAWQPGSGQVRDAIEAHVGGRQVAFAGTICHTLAGTLPTRICTLNLDTTQLRVLTDGPNIDRHPKFSPDGRLIAYLSDRQGAGNFQLFLLDPQSGTTRRTPAVDGWVEYLHWSPDGRRILLAVAGHGADVAGGHGAVSSRKLAAELPSWMPAVATGDEDYRWRTVWIYDLDADRVRQVSVPGQNVWEAVWCGPNAIAAIASDSPTEGHWYSAHLEVLDLASGERRVVFRPKDQLGWLAASPSGRWLSVVEAVCSDRWIVAGDLKLIESKTGGVSVLDTNGVDVSYAEWRDDDFLLYAGHRGFETAIGGISAGSARSREIWSSSEITTAGRYASVAGIDASGDCVLVGESFTRTPEIAVIRRGKYECLKALHGRNDEPDHVICRAEQVSWRSPDDLEVQGWLLLPSGRSPFPLVMGIHGGPILHWRPSWLARSSFGLGFLLLLAHGIAVFLPNPRGSSGRGQPFARLVVGDMGGADAADCLSGLDDLVGRGIADPNRLGVTGGSYGGFMTCWLVAHDSRFSAAVPVAPVTNHVTERLISNIPHFNDLFLKDSYRHPAGQYFNRSPIMHAHRVRTPTLNICGALDRCTPPEEAMQFHAVLLENGVESVLVTYPEEGHGVRSFPAEIDFAARLSAWFMEHLGIEN